MDAPDRPRLSVSLSLRKERDGASGVAETVLWIERLSLGCAEIDPPGLSSTKPPELS